MLEQLAIQTKLAERFSELKVKNPSYSLRSYAKKLGLSSSAISEILSGKRSVSVKIAKRISESLCLSPKESQSLVNLFQKKSKAFNPLSQDQYHVISEWYHFAILSLSETAGFVDSVEWIAQRLGVGQRQVRQALARLERMGLMKKDPRTGVLRATGEEFSTTDGISDASVRNGHFQNLELAQKSLEQDPLDHRDFTAMTMAIDPDRIEEAKKMIREFRDKLCMYLEGGTKKEVYKMAFQLFPLSKRARMVMTTPFKEATKS